MFFSKEHFFLNGAGESKIQKSNNNNKNTQIVCDRCEFLGGGRVVRRCWVNFQCRGVLLICMIVGQGPTALAVGGGGGCLDTFTLVYPFSPLSPSLWETARYRLKYCVKGPLNPKQPTNQQM